MIRIDRIDFFCYLLILYIVFNWIQLNWIELNSIEFIYKISIILNATIKYKQIKLVIIIININHLFILVCLLFIIHYNKLINWINQFINLSIKLTNNSQQFHFISKRVYLLHKLLLLLPQWLHVIIYPLQLLIITIIIFLVYHMNRRSPPFIVIIIHTIPSCIHTYTTIITTTTIQLQYTG